MQVDEHPSVKQPMKFDPGFGTENPKPSDAAQYREQHRNMAWLFNPWTGARRHPLDIGSDPFGHLVMPTDITY